jgi:uncharacterized damage-inducible protein DinB
MMFPELIRYNNWANRLVLDACKKLSDDQLATPIPGAYGTIRETLEHIVRAEAFYVELLTGDRPQPPFQWEARPGLDEVSDYADQVGRALIDVADRIRPTDPVDEQGEDWQLHYEALALFIQIIDHGIEHRTNITTILNQGLQEPPEVDGWAYLWAHPDRFDLKRSGPS